MLFHSRSLNIQSRSLSALFALILLGFLIFPLLVSAEDTGGVTPDPNPPPPEGEEDARPDTTDIIPVIEGATLSYLIDLESASI